MDLRPLALALLEGGTVRLPLGAPPPRADDASCDDLLAELDDAARRDAPAVAPALGLASARWGLARTCRLAQLVVDRELPVEVVAADLAAARADAPDREDPRAIWSVDLALSRLPDLERQARGLAPADPLVEALRELGEAWPLSAVGVPRPAAGEDLARPDALPRALRDDPCLRRLYVDRVIAAGDRARLTTPWVAAAVRAALGAVPELAPAVARALEVPAPTEP